MQFNEYLTSLTSSSSRRAFVLFSASALQQKVLVMHVSSIRKATSVYKRSYRASIGDLHDTQMQDKIPHAIMEANCISLF